jgi:uncharacterized SAM-binding protein YcdF (DUF218 family)
MIGLWVFYVLVQFLQQLLFVLSSINNIHIHNQKKEKEKKIYSAFEAGFVFVFCFITNKSNVSRHIWIFVFDRLESIDNNYNDVKNQLFIIL